MCLLCLVALLQICFFEMILFFFFCLSGADHCNPPLPGFGQKHWQGLLLDGCWMLLWRWFSENWIHVLHPQHWLKADWKVEVGEVNDIPWNENIGRITSVLSGVSSLKMNWPTLWHVLTSIFGGEESKLEIDHTNKISLVFGTRFQIVYKNYRAVCLASGLLLQPETSYNQPYVLPASLKNQLGGCVVYRNWNFSLTETLLTISIVIHVLCYE